MELYSHLRPTYVQSANLQIKLVSVSAAFHLLFCPKVMVPRLGRTMELYSQIPRAALIRAVCTLEGLKHKMTAFMLSVLDNRLSRVYITEIHFYFYTGLAKDPINICSPGWSATLIACRVLLLFRRSGFKGI